MLKENSSTSQNHLLSLLMAYKNKKVIEDDFGNKVMMFFNEKPLEITSLIGKYKYHKVSRKKGTIEDDIILRMGIIQLKESSENIEKNQKFNVLNFIEYGQDRGKDWQEINYELYISLMPKPKQKLINPKKRKKYVI